MNISTQCLEQLPALAWLADVQIDSGDTTVSHGKWVEAHGHFLVEGAWDGEFALGRFDATPNFFGSGAVFLDDRAVFVSSCATTDYLYYRVEGNSLAVSNSLAFLLSRINDELDPSNTDYWNDCESITNGIDAYQPAIRTRKGEVRRLLYRNLIVAEGSVRIVDKAPDHPFSSYEDYIASVRVAYAGIARNARDPARRRSLRILSTQSKGYDSTAVNAIAAEFGIDAAFTVSQSKGGGSFAEHDTALQGDDDGREIAQHLGFECIPIDRRRFQDGLEDEYLYFAGVANCEDLNFSGMTPFIDGPSILLTGTLGELYYPGWYYPQRFPGVPVGGDLRRGDLGGHGLTEVRLETGFIQVAPIYIGARQRECITRITESPAMDAWRVGGTYDRPIARRIAEEAGVPRTAFGQKKMATTVSFSRPNIPHNAQLRREFFSYLVAEKSLSRWQVGLFPLAHRINSLIWFASPRRNKPVYYLSRLHAKLTGKPLPLLWSRLESALHCFSVNKRIRDYPRRAELARDGAH